jgi:hypothetical protein
LIGTAKNRLIGTKDPIWRCKIAFPLVDIRAFV